MPAAGMDRFAYLAAKFGGTERARQVHGVIEETAIRDGIPMHLDRIRRVPKDFAGGGVDRRECLLDSDEPAVDQQSAVDL